MKGSADRSLSLQGRGTGAQRQGEGPRGRGKTPEHLLKLARAARQEMTEAEERLWAQLRGRRLGGLKFRRQQPMGQVRPDFLCAECKLIVEVDGSQHADAPSDAIRTMFLEREGYRVLRVWNNDVLARMQSVLEAVLAATAPHPARFASCPSPLKGEGR